VRLVRKHHPLEGQTFEVVLGGRATVVVRLGDGTRMRLPRSWTDMDGIATSAAERLCTVDSLREVLELLEALRRKA